MNAMKKQYAVSQITGGRCAVFVFEWFRGPAPPAKPDLAGEKTGIQPGSSPTNLRQLRRYDSIDCIRTADLAQKFLRRRQIHIFFALKQLRQLFDFVRACARANRQ